MKLGIKDISNVYLGSKEIDKIYLGSKEVYSSFNINDDLVLQYTSRSNLDLLETKSGQNYNAKLLPSTFVGGNSAYYLFETVQNLGKVHKIKFRAVVGAANYICANSTTWGATGSWIVASTNNITYRVNGANQSITVTMANGVHDVIVDRNNKTITVYVDGVAQTPYTLSDANNVDWYVYYIGKVATNYNSTEYSYFSINDEDHEYILHGSYPIYDTGINTTKLNLRQSGIVSSNKIYSINASILPITRGCSYYNKAFETTPIFVPYSTSGAITITPPTDYAKKTDSIGVPNKVNLCDAMVDFDYLGATEIAKKYLDRSNTTYFNATARSGFYDASHPYRFHLFELNQLKLFSMYNDDYKWIVFNHWDTNSIYDSTRLFIDEILTYSGQKTAIQAKKILKYTGDNGILHDLTYSFETIHWCANRGNKVLAFDNVDTLSLSTDGGTTFNITKQLTSFGGIVTFAHIFENGNILFCSHTKAYLSTDNLSTYSEIAVKGIDGNAFVPGTLNNFRSTGYNNVSINGTEILVWGAYITAGTAEYTNINAWYSTDNGLTVKSCFKFGTTLPLAARHIHAISFNPSDNSWWMQTGDGTDECHWIKGTYNLSTDTWTWVKIAGDNEPSSSTYSNHTYYKTVGMVFKEGYVYWGSDSQLNTRYGIYRAPYNDITNKSLYEHLYTTNNVVVGLQGDSTELVATVNGGKYMLTSIDFKTFLLRTLTGGPTLHSTYPCMLPIGNKDSNDNYRMEIIDSTETIDNFTANDILKIKLVKY